MTDRKRTKWVHGGIVGESVHADIEFGLKLLVDEPQDAEKFGLPADFDIERMWSDRQHTKCLVCGDKWIHHVNWDCVKTRRRW